ncbi:MAG: hypothetical protein H8F28_01250 [Fibrella sp.]|nr:hypothetical protein [Armatimonadota bacterium]
MHLRLHEHETRRYDWTDRDLRAIVRLNQGAGAELVRAVVDARGHKCLRAFQHVGVLRLAPGRTVHIVPKIHRPTGEDVTDGGVRRALQALIRWLGYAGTLPFHAAERAALEMQNPDWFEVMTRFFAENLRNEWRRGPVRTYISQDDDHSSNLVGRWRVADQLRRPAEKSVFCVTRDEFSGDTPLNRVLRYVCELLRRRTADRQNRAILDGVAGEMDADAITLPHSVTLADADPARILSRLNVRYAPLLSLARLFLSNRSAELLPGQTDDTETWAFTLDMNHLFEQFVAGFIARHRTLCLPDDLADCTILPQTRGAIRYLATRETPPTQNLFALEPDIAFQNPADKSFPLLLDTKYKRLDGNERTNLGVSQSDLYQMFAYAHRYDCPRVILLYPATTDAEIGERAVFRFGDFGATNETLRHVIVATIDTRNDLRTAADVGCFADELNRLLTIIHTKI